MSKWQWILKQFGARLWVRASLFCILGVATALAALLLKDFIPENISRRIGAEAAGNILQIIASSMLVVTTFSLSVMVAAYSAASSNVSPRATHLLLQDSKAQNALSVFIGAFLYSLVGIIVLHMEVYDASGRLVLFLVTIGVIVLIIAVLLQWIDYLSRLGRVGETIHMVECATAEALKQRIASPYLGGKALRNYQPQENHHPVHCEHIGYIQYMDMAALSHLAKKHETEFFLHQTPGGFNDGVKPLLYSTAPLDEEATRLACAAYSIGNHRSFDQDPRFGMVVLCEIASRALSSAINDPGTAIDIIGTSLRILAPWVMSETPEPEPLHPNLHVPPLEVADVFDDIYASLVRDGTGNLQIAIRLQKSFISLAGMGNAEVTAEAVKLSQYALAYANETLLIQSDKDTVAALAKEVK